MKLSTRAETLVSLLQLEYLSGSNRSSLVEERNALSSVCSFIWCDFRISASNTPLVSILFSGHYVGFCFRKAGPLYHLSSSARVDTLSPLVSKSNAFSLVGTHLHCSGLVDAWISPTSISHKWLNLPSDPVKYAYAVRPEDPLTLVNAKHLSYSLCKFESCKSGHEFQLRYANGLEWCNM